jgi:hypothetical protein
LAKSTIKPEDAQNPVSHLGLERDFSPSIAVQAAASEFANSIIIGTQIYGRLRNWMPAVADALPLEQTGQKCHPSFSL